MVKVKKCLDTYALVEIANANPKFAEYLNSDFAITDLTLAEFYAVLLREEGEKVADYWFRKLERYSVSLDKEILIEAIKFRYAHRKTNISFFDAVGYVFSVKNGYYFVTGDKEFEKFDFVEFKKK
ncbi:PIN domain-containing protein [Candidatus Pacearchaeota archaeon]|nr:PIN domain-containing protein [Candidatus Pacearchaeota archaeon]